MFHTGCTSLQHLFSVQANKIVLGLSPMSWLHLDGPQLGSYEALEVLWVSRVVGGLTVAVTVLHSLECPSSVDIGYLRAR